MAEFVIFKPLYVVGDQVEVYYNGQWEEGVVTDMRRLGFIEYDIRLSIGVDVKEVQALSMRKVGASASQSSRSGPVDAISSSQPEVSIPYAFSQDILINPHWVDSEEHTGGSRDGSGSPEIPYPAKSDVGPTDSGDGHVVHGPPIVTRRFCPDRNVEAAVSFIVENIDNVGDVGHPDTSKEDALNSRFPDISEEDLDALANNSQSPNTHRATMWGVGVFRDWLRSRNLEVDFENLQIGVLAGYLGRFYAAARNQKGKLYARSSLRGIRAAIQRFLSLPPNNLAVNIIGGAEFIKANNVITGALRSMKEAGLDKSKQHPPISPLDMAKLYSSGALSHATPTCLQWKTFFEISLHFGRRGREGLRHLKKQDIVFKDDGSGTEYATLDFHSLEKNHQGLKAHESEHVQRMYATGKAKCPVSSLKVYLSRLHPKCEWLFQRPKVVNFVGNDIWYYNSPVGVNTISDYMPKISLFAQTSIRYTNHCIRATAVTTLKELFDGEDVIAVTGHKSTTSLLHYAKTSDARRKEMSAVLTAALGVEKQSVDGLNIRAPAPGERQNTDSQATQGYTEGREASVVGTSGSVQPALVVPVGRKTLGQSATVGGENRVDNDVEVIAANPGIIPISDKDSAKKSHVTKRRKRVVEPFSSDEDEEEAVRKRNRLLYDSPNKVPCSQVVWETNSSDSDQEGGNRSLFKGCTIDKIQIFYK